MVAYVVPLESALVVSALRAFLQERLPGYMVPALFVTLEKMPLTANHKIDRKALPAPEGERPEVGGEYLAPRNEVEETLARVWAHVLGVDHVGVEDDFFELGGDSILSIQIVARAKQAGLRLQVGQVFDHPTVAQLALVAESTDGSGSLDQDLVSGSVPMTPVQHYFFENFTVDPHHFNMSLLLEVKTPLDARLLELALEQLLLHHDALRLCFVGVEEAVRQENAGREAAQLPVLQVDFSALAVGRHAEALEAVGDRVQAGLELDRAPLLRALYFHRGRGRSDRLLLVVHHLVTDGVSWRILTEDLQAAYAQLSAGEPVLLPPKTTSFKQWAERLCGLAGAPSQRQQVSFWLERDNPEAAEIPFDMPKGVNTVASNRQLRQLLTAEETHALLHEVPPVYNTQINDVLLSALLLAWEKWSGQQAVRVDLEGHGREDLFEDVDISRTVGWFTTIYPIELVLPASLGPGEVLKKVKEDLRQVPDHGVGYGILRYLSEDAATRSALGALPKAGLSFNYLGQIDPGSDDAEAPMRLASESAGAGHSHAQHHTHPLAVEGQVAAGRLEMSFSFSENLFHRDSIESLALFFMESLHALIEHCKSPEAGGFTASDFSLSELDEEDLEAAFDEVDW
jgi:non-ribosomal peptide synthase protein (TIGR01720 family)